MIMPYMEGKKVIQQQQEHYTEIVSMQLLNKSVNEDLTQYLFLYISDSSSMTIKHHVHTVYGYIFKVAYAFKVL